jgi:hypothetical protein
MIWRSEKIAAYFMPPPWPISPKRKLIVLHTPKCGGSSLLVSLTKAFGRDAIHRDYRYIRGVRTQPAHVIDAPVIYGHFRASKYEHVNQARWVTLLREPIDRMLSLYFNWKFSPPSMLKNKMGAFRREVQRGDIGLVDFASQPSMANRLHRFYFGGFDMGRFDLIIPHDNYSEGVLYLGKMIGKPLTVEVKNVSSSRSLAYEEARREVMADEATMGRLRDILRAEIEFYERCMALPSVRHRGVDGG